MSPDAIFVNNNGLEEKKKKRNERFIPFRFMRLAELN